MVGRLASHSKKVGKIMKPRKIPLKSDIIKLCSYIMSQYRRLLAELTSSINKFTAYDELTDCLVAYILCLVRRGPAALQKATVSDYQ